MIRWKPKVDHRRVHDPFGGLLSEEVERLRKEGCHKIVLEKDPLKNDWHIEAHRHVRVED